MPRLTNDRPRKGATGFTLIEVMIVVVIIGILLAVTLPGYRNTVIRSNRATAQGDLLAFAQAMEKEYAINFTYTNAAAGTTFPNRSPLDGDNKKYILSVDPNDVSYMLTATPIGGGTQDGDGIIQINHLGQRFWDKNDDGDTSDTGENNWDR